ncbi:contractile injection system protein, VgrG/Pvc8 family [Pseudorhodoferax sp. Leaf267]|uniref:contractile injection system protein, VgrG/Pvc8 family n=1 Tax=Pseudorhodoferax sp. Leaf267 TaxID=1736316 RepID=UPI0006FC65CE|nr:contractile injection system protein, VgrG/Pvc8 family [Pseudorhodoferax sp. Leaf267]KQP13683.1 hypothetical protein ASF43_17455 [Pseudorhodoferax sp. Leaf267]
MASAYAARTLRARYRLSMRLWLSLLFVRRDSRMFQDKTAVQIVEQVFAHYAQASFVLRLLAKEGPSEPLAPPGR